MSFETISNVEGCAEVVLSVCRERGLRVAIHEPDLGRDIKFKIVAPNLQAFLSARAEWGRRLSVSDTQGRLSGASIPTRKTRSRL